MKSLVTSALDDKRYSEAESLLHRQLFFAQKAVDKELILTTSWDLARVENTLEDHDLAARYYALADSISEESSLADSIIWKLRLERVNFHLQAEQAGKALVLIKSYRGLQSSEEIAEELLFLEAISALMVNDIATSRSICLSLSSPADSSLIVDAFSRYRSDRKKYDPTKVAWKSRFLPGLGQLQTRNYKAAINSFILVGGIVTGAVFLSSAYTIFDGVLATAPFFIRYYKGGIARSRSYAEQRIERSKKDLIRDISVILQDR
jgi:hypothetical protein